MTKYWIFPDADSNQKGWVLEGEEPESIIKIAGKPSRGYICVEWENGIPFVPYAGGNIIKGSRHYIAGIESDEAGVPLARLPTPADPCVGEDVCRACGERMTWRGSILDGKLACAHCEDS